MIATIFTTDYIELQWPMVINILQIDNAERGAKIIAYRAWGWSQSLENYSRWFHHSCKAKVAKKIQTSAARRKNKYGKSEIGVKNIRKGSIKEH